MNVLIGLAILCLGLFQIYATYMALRNVQLHGNKNTSPFMPLALYSGIFLGVVFSGLGLATIIHFI